MNSRKAVFALFLALTFGATACSAPTEAPPAPSAAATTPTAEETDAALTDKQHHIKEDAIIALGEGAYSKRGVIDYLAEEYPTEDVKIAVGAMSCEADWKLEAMQKAEGYGITDKVEIKKRLLDDGFTEEEAEFGTNPIK